MPNYRYRILSETGQIRRGRIIAVNKSQAIDRLKGSNNQPIYIRKINKPRKKYKLFTLSRLDRINKQSAFGTVKRLRRKKIAIKDMTLEDLKAILTPIKTEDIITFVNNFYILKKAKFNNVQALQSILEGTENPRMKDIVEDLLIGVEAGERLYKIMDGYPKVFNAMFVNFIRVGEESGTLDTALLYARDYVESSTKLRKKIKAAVIPRVLQFFGIIAAMFAALLIGVPLLEDVYDMFDSSATIPEATLVALDFTKWIIANWYYIVGIIVVLVSIFIIYINTSKGRFNWDKFKLTCPVVGPLMTNITINKFFQAMLLNLKNGMRIQESLEVSKNVTNNYYFLSIVEAGKAMSASGGSWLQPFEEKKIFNPMIMEMVGIGMQTDLSEMMEKVNEYIAMKIDESIARFVKVLPDVTYIFVGIALIAFCITVMVPLTDVYMGGFIDIPQ